jgi:hypothetical protein
MRILLLEDVYGGLSGGPLNIMPTLIGERDTAAIHRHLIMAIIGCLRS